MIEVAGVPPHMRTSITSPWAPAASLASGLQPENTPRTHGLYCIHICYMRTYVHQRNKKNMKIINKCRVI